MMLFPKFLFLATNFPRKWIKIQFSHWIFIKKFQNFLKISQTIVFFVQTRENLPHGFEIFLQNRRKYSIFCNFLREFFCKFSKILRRPGAPPHGPPTRPDPLPWTPPRNFFLRTPLLPPISNWKDYQNPETLLSKSLSYKAYAIALCLHTVRSGQHSSPTRGQDL